MHAGSSAGSQEGVSPFHVRACADCVSGPFHAAVDCELSQEGCETDGDLFIAQAILSNDITVYIVAGGVEGG